MSQQPLTYESVLQLIQKVAKQSRRNERKFERMSQETDRKLQATAKQSRRNERKFERMLEASAKEAAQETDRKIQATAEQRKETDQWIEETKQMFQRTAEQIDATNKAIDATNKAVGATNKAIDATNQAVGATNQAVGALSGKVGGIAEKLLGEGKLVDQFRELGHKVKRYSQRMIFGEKGTAESGEIDMFLEDGDVAILVEAKTTLKMDDVRDHIERIEKYRRFADAQGYPRKRFIGAVAGTVIAENVINFAHENGLYVIIQSARAVEIIPQPVGFVAHEW